MRTEFLVPVVLLATAVSGGGQELAIESFNGTGSLVFEAIPSATTYRVEWAPSPAGPWSDFAAAAGELDAIVGPGSGLMTCQVPTVYRVVAELAPPPPLDGMVLVPAGDVQIGDNIGDGWWAEVPVHTVYLSAFYLEPYEVTKALWDEVRSWALTNGYSFASGAGKGPTHPVQWVTWYDCLKWCNARSEMEGLEPVYHLTSRGTRVYRSGEYDLGSDYVRWQANGYRLPTSAEWEKAARGGQVGERFPWGTTISHSQANYWAGLENYDLSRGVGYHPSYRTGGYPYTSPVGSFAPHGYGLYDMAGNVGERCWDWFDEDWYSQPAATQDNPTGPDSSPVGRRTIRMGNWDSTANAARCAFRSSVGPGEIGNNLGLRCARTR